MEYECVCVCARASLYVVVARGREAGRGSGGGGGRRRRDCSAAVPTQYSSNKNKGTGRREVFEKGTRQYPHCRPVAKRPRRVMEWLWDLALRLKGKWTLTVLTTSGPPHRLPPPPFHHHHLPFLSVSGRASPPAHGRRACIAVFALTVLSRCSPTLLLTVLCIQSVSLFFSFS